jgi:hypothetical protein
MNYAELQQAILDDTHKSQYAGATIQRMIAEGEALIAAHLESYNLLVQLTDADRISASSPIYNLPSRLTHLRHVKIAGRPLDKIDETSVYLRNRSTVSTGYVQRIGQIEIAGNPGEDSLVDLDYMGMPEPLASVGTNNLLDEVPQLYKDATGFYVFRRAQDYESAELSLQSLVSMCAQLNRKTKKLLGGAEAAPAYNTRFRSSY